MKRWLLVLVAVVAVGVLVFRNFRGLFGVHVFQEEEVEANSRGGEASRGGGHKARGGESSNIIHNKRNTHHYPSSPPPFEWSACMIVKNENMGLPEWLAYHMTVLPLKRFILAIDPTSKTNPRPILEHFERELGLEWTVWEYDDYFREGRSRGTSFKKYNYSHKILPNGTFTPITDPQLLYKSHLWRQSVFLEKCLKTLRQEEQRRTWTLLIDTDEFMSYNPYRPDEMATILCQNHRTRDECQRNYHDDMQRNQMGVHMRTRVPRTSILWTDVGVNATSQLYYAATNQSDDALVIPPTMAHYLDWYMNDLMAWDKSHELPCWGMQRMNFGAYTTKELLHLQVRGVVNTVPRTPALPNLDTLQYRWHSQFPLNNLAKCMVNVDTNNANLTTSGSRHGGVNPHRALPKGSCRNAPFSMTEKNIFRIHHYASSLEATLARGKTREDFVSRQPNISLRLQETWDATWWWPVFVRKVGSHERALNLTVGLRQWAMEEYAQAYYNNTTTTTPVL